MFREQERRLDGLEKEIAFTEFLEKRNKRALEVRREKVLQKKLQRSTLLKKDD